jgi:ACS family sodium-dependent inorganic phosphate cotransporter-like MFS transporter 5
MQLLWRYVLAWMGCLGIMNVYFCRINLSMAMVAMVGVEGRAAAALNSSSCPGRGAVLGQEGRLGEFAWSKREQGLVTGSYYWSYAACQIPAAWLAARFGFRRVFGLSMLVASLVTLVFPLAARASVGLAVAARVLLGIFHAVAFPAMTGAWAVWAPPMERTQLNGIYWSGASVGTLTIFTLAGYVADSLGWPAIFYVTGCCSLAWVAAWFLLVWDSPALHPRITAAERDYIESSLGSRQSEHRPAAVPWRALLTSLPVWGCVLGHAASNWGNYTLNQQLPTYLANVLRFSLSFNGLLASLCYLAQWLVCLSASWLTDQVRARGLLSTLTVRKLNTLLGLWVTAAAAILAVYAGCRAELAVTLFAVSAGLNTLTVPGCKSGLLDIAPAYATIGFGLSNTLANVPGFVAPSLVGALLTDYSEAAQWQAVFWVSAGVHVAGSLLYLGWGQAEVQPWAARPGEEGKGDRQP